MTQAVIDLTPEQIKRADDLRELLAEASLEVRRGARRRARRIKVGFQLTDRCKVSGVDGTLKSVSVTGALFVVRDNATREDIEIPNCEVISHTTGDPVDR